MIICYNILNLVSSSFNNESNKLLKSDEEIQQLRPDVLVKGGDYTPETVVGRAEVELYGGTVVIVPYVDEVSTTGIIHSILKRYSSPESGE